MPIPGSTFTKEGLGLKRCEKIVEDSYIDILAFMKSSEYRLPTSSYVMQRRLLVRDSRDPWWDYPFYTALGFLITEEEIAPDPHCSYLEKFLKSPQFEILSQADPLHTQPDFERRFNEMYEAKERPLVTPEDFAKMKKKFPRAPLKSERMPGKSTVESVLKDPFWLEAVFDDRKLLRAYAEAVFRENEKRVPAPVMGVEISDIFLSKPVGYALCLLESGLQGSKLIIQGIDSQWLRTYGGLMLLVRPPAWWEYVLGA